MILSNLIEMHLLLVVHMLSLKISAVDAQLLL